MSEGPARELERREERGRGEQKGEGEGEIRTREG